MRHSLKLHICDLMAVTSTLGQYPPLTWQQEEPLPSIPLDTLFDVDDSIIESLTTSIEEMTNIGDTAAAACDFQTYLANSSLCNKRISSRYLFPSVDEKRPPSAMSPSSDLVIQDFHKSSRVILRQRASSSICIQQQVAEKSHVPEFAIFNVICLLQAGRLAKILTRLQ